MRRRWLLTLVGLLGLSGTVAVRQCLAQGPRQRTVVVLGESDAMSDCAWRHQTVQPHHWRDCTLRHRWKSNSELRRNRRRSFFFMR